MSVCWLVNRLVGLSKFPKKAGCHSSMPLEPANLVLLQCLPLAGQGVLLQVQGPRESGQPSRDCAAASQVGQLCTVTKIDINRVR